MKRMSVTALLISVMLAATAAAYETGKGAPWNLSAAVKEAVEDTSTNQEFVSYEYKGFFVCDIPKQWSINDGTMQFGLKPEEKKVYGIYLYGPSEADIPVRISVHFYAEGNLLHKSMERYIKAHSQPILGYVPEGSSYGPVQEITIAGRKAKKFEQKKSEFVGSRSLLPDPGAKDPRVYEKMARKVYALEQYIVIPAEKGFYVLSLRTPEDSASLFQPVFDRVVNSFKPLK
ncbi:MAG: hypothetical protein LLF86_05945 [Nitrospiraceae bacterium]|nr:hypothetical protein [Nitrospiraceae bacterium]